jgi:hypothetical protein
MKASSLAALSIATMLLNSTVCFAQSKITSNNFLDAKTIKTIGGNLALKEIGKDDGKYDLIINGKRVTTIEERNVSFEYKFSLAGTDVILISLSSGGNGCPANYRFATVTQGGKVAVSDEFGNCNDDPQVAADPTKIVVSLRSGQGRRIKTETWTYMSGTVEKTR